MEAIIHEQDIETKADTSKQAKWKLYTKWTVAWWSYLGGPIAGCYFLSKNFTALGYEQKAKNAMLTWIISSIVMFWTLLALPESIIDNIPSSVIPITYTVVIYQYLMQTQQKEIQEHMDAGGERYSGWRVTGISFLFLLLTMACVLWVIFVLLALGIEA